MQFSNVNSHSEIQLIYFGAAANEPANIWVNPQENVIARPLIS